VAHGSLGVLVGEEAVEEAAVGSGCDELQAQAADLLDAGRQVAGRVHGMLEQAQRRTAPLMAGRGQCEEAAVMQGAQGTEAGGSLQGAGGRTEAEVFADAVGEGGPAEGGGIGDQAGEALQAVGGGKGLEHKRLALHPYIGNKSGSQC